MTQLVMTELCKQCYKPCKVYSNKKSSIIHCPSYREKLNNGSKAQATIPTKEPIAELLQKPKEGESQNAG